METIKLLKKISAEVEHIFILKNKDYGMSWSVFRQITFADQILMKTLRIINCQKGTKLQINDSIKSDWIAIANYSILAIILEENSTFQSAEIESVYKEKILDIQELFIQKNSDYDESWKKMEVESITDLIHAKIERIKNIIKNEGQVNISEGIASNYRDIYMYSILCLIKMNEL